MASSQVRVKDWMVQLERARRRGEARMEVERMGRMWDDVKCIVD